MAEQIEIKGSAYQGKIRNPLGVVGLGIVTLGIYYFVWYFKVNKEMAELGQAKGTEECGARSDHLADWRCSPAGLIIVPPFVSTYKACKRLNASERGRRRAGGDRGAVALAAVHLHRPGRPLHLPAQPQPGTPSAGLAARGQPRPS